MATRKLVVDTSHLQRDTRQLAAGLSAGGLRESYHQANRTAAKIHARVPVRTGRLAATVTAVKVAGGYGVTYGGGLPYAGYIENRKHPVRSGARGSRAEFYRALQALTVGEVGKV